MNLLPSEFFTIEQIRQAEQQAMAERISETELMQRAASGAYAAMLDFFGTPQKIAIFCGKGNNGGDGYVIARLAQQDGIDVQVYRLCDVNELPTTAKQAAQAAKESGIDILPFTDDIKLDADLIIDAMLGFGLTGEVRGDFVKAIECINQSYLPVLAIDIPSGIHADTGAVLGTAVKAHLTVTFAGLKQGLVTSDAVDHCGQIHFCDLGVEDIMVDTPCSAMRLDYTDCLASLSPRKRSAHKRDFGHLLIVGGDLGMPGSVIMTSQAALRSGAGLVTVATRPEHVVAVASSCHEAMVLGIEQTQQLSACLDKATAVAIGPGMTDSEWSKQCWQTVIDSGLPLVVDAGALRLLSQQALQRENWVLTPHPGEAADLLALPSAKHVQNDRFAAAALIQQQYQGVVVLKGPGTIVRNDQDLPEICTHGNPGMASAGMGDVLTGIIAGLIAQQFDLHVAACLGVCLHALAGDQAATDGERGMIASDLIEHIQGLVNPEQIMDSQELRQLMLSQQMFEQDD